VTGTCKCGNVPWGSIQRGKSVDQLRTCCLLKDSDPWSKYVSKLINILINLTDISNIQWTYVTVKDVYCAHEVRTLSHRGRQYKWEHDTVRQHRWNKALRKSRYSKKDTMKGQAYGLGYRMEFIKPDLSEANNWRYQSSARYYAIG
jgi:hypothetical protein